MSRVKKNTQDLRIQTSNEKLHVPNSASTFFKKISARLHDMLPDKSPFTLHNLGLHQLKNEDEQRRAQLYLDTTRARYIDLYEQAPVGYCTIDAKGEIVQNNLFMSTLLGLPRNQLLRRPIEQFIVNNDLTIYHSLQNAMIATGESQSHQLRMVTTNGTITWVKMSIAADKRDTEAELYHFTLIDINEHKKAEESLRLASSVFTHTREGILVTDSEGSIIDVNAAFTRITQYTRDEVLGKDTRFLKSEQHNNAFYENLWNSLLTKGYWHGEVWNRKKNGELYAELKSINAVYDESHNVINYVSLFKDITEKELHQTHLEHIAHFDALTGLPNRSLLIDRINQSITQSGRRDEMFAVIFIDLDGFKAINDQYGHEAGDQLLITLSSRMRQALREGDTLSRFGGDEFVALLMDLPNMEASIPTLSRLLQCAAEPVQFDDTMLQVSASLGVTFYQNGQDKNVGQLLRQADQAMYYAKLDGKNNYHIYNDQDIPIHNRRENR